jgi:hypothetical protein
MVSTLKKVIPKPKSRKKYTINLTKNGQIDLGYSSTFSYFFVPTSSLPICLLLKLLNLTFGGSVIFSIFRSKICFILVSSEVVGTSWFKKVSLPQ